jgi:hypothetical protein
MTHAYTSKQYDLINNVIGILRCDSKSARYLPCGYSEEELNLS